MTPSTSQAAASESARTSDERALEAFRPRMLGIAYRMLGSVSDAEDIVQDAFVRYMRARENGVAIESLEAYLSTVVTRLSIDYVRSARVRRERYVGLWLPEPLLTDTGVVALLDGSDGEDESLSMAFLLMLERLGPVERAVFLLHDVFSYPFERVADIVGKTVVNCRRIATRARQRIQGGQRFPRSSGDGERLAAQFFAALADGDVDKLVGMLAEDVTVYGDGGGNAPQWTQPIRGAARVSKLMAGLGRKARDARLRIELRQVNGAPGALVREENGDLLAVYALEIRDGAVQAFRSVINPEKLRHLGPVADMRAFLRKLAEPHTITAPSAAP